MRKKIISMLLAISVIITGICSCSSTPDISSSQSSSTSSSSEVTLKVTETLSTDGKSKLYKSEDLKVITTNSPTQVIKWKFSKPYEGEDKLVTLKLSRTASSVKAEKESEGHKMADNNSDVEVSATLKNGDTEIAFEVKKEIIEEAKEIEVELPKEVEVKEVVAEEADTTNSTTITTTQSTTTSKAPETTTVKETTTTTATTKKPEETEAPKTTTTTATTAVPATEAPKPKWTEEKMDTTTMYVSVESCYSREKAVLGATTSKLYYFADKVDVVAKTDTGYYKLKDGTFIHSDYLTSSKPETTTSAPATEKPKPATTTTTTSKPAETTPPKSEPKYAPNGEKIDDETAEHIDEVWTEKYYDKPKYMTVAYDFLCVRKYPVRLYGEIMYLYRYLNSICIIGETNNEYLITQDHYYVYKGYMSDDPDPDEIKWDPNGGLAW